MKYQIISLLAFVLLFTAKANAQDTIMLMSGKRLIVSNGEVKTTPKGDTIVAYQLKNKQKKKSASKIFSVSNSGGEQLFYTQEYEEDLTVSQMRNYLNGLADFRQGFSWGAFAGGVASVAGAAAVPTIDIKGNVSGSIPVGVVVPFAYLGIISNTGKSVAKLKRQKPDMSEDEYYITGAQAAVGRMRFRSGLFGVVAGGVVWMTVSLVTD